MSNHLHDAFLGRHAGRSAPFLIDGTGAVTTHDAFLRRAARFARVLASLGVEPGDRVAAQVAKSPDALALYAACVRAGADVLRLDADGGGGGTLPERAGGMDGDFATVPARRTTWPRCSAPPARRGGRRGRCRVRRR